jgi:hypothetical protein
MPRKSRAALLAGLAALSLASAAAQDDDEASDEPVRCLSMTRVCCSSKPATRSS